MIRATTPSGSRTDTFIRPGPIGMLAPFISVTSPAKKSICAAATSASPIIARTGFPQSIASSVASSRVCSRTIAANRRSAFARSSGGTFLHSRKARRALSTAASTSAAEASAAWPSDSPEPGLDSS
jgi:hypothetical protein